MLKLLFVSPRLIGEMNDMKLVLSTIYVFIVGLLAACETSADCNEQPSSTVSTFNNKPMGAVPSEHAHIIRWKQAIFRLRYSGNEKRMNRMKNQKWMLNWRTLEIKKELTSLIPTRYSFSHYMNLPATSRSLGSSLKKLKQSFDVRKWWNERAVFRCKKTNAAFTRRWHLRQSSTDKAYKFGFK